MTNAKTMVAVLAIGMVAVALTGCREEEQGRIIVEEKGVYQGPADQKLDEDRLKELRQRNTLQNF